MKVIKTGYFIKKKQKNLRSEAKKSPPSPHVWSPAHLMFYKDDCSKWKWKEEIHQNIHTTNLCSSLQNSHNTNTNKYMGFSRKTLQDTCTSSANWKKKKKAHVLDVFLIMNISLWHSYLQVFWSKLITNSIWRCQLARAIMKTMLKQWNYALWICLLIIYIPSTVPHFSHQAPLNSGKF